MLKALLDSPMGRVGLGRGPVGGRRHNVERAGLSSMREVINEASYLSRRTEEDLVGVGEEEGSFEP